MAVLGDEYRLFRKEQFSQAHEGKGVKKRRLRSMVPEAE